MRLRVTLGFWAVLLAFAPLAVWGQSPTSTSRPATSSADLSDLLNRGQLLETERRWGEALSLYEDALRQLPIGQVEAARGSLEQRLQFSRMHYDLTRRYHDSSFRDSLAAMSGREALDLYSEVLLKIQSHYVEAPDWAQLVNHGTMGLEVALADPLFVEAHLADVSPARVEHVRRTLRSKLKPQKIDSRHAARDFAAQAARVAAAELGLSDATVVLEFICGATNSLDPYSTFLTAGQLNEVYSQIEGNFVGLGIELKADDGALLIVKTITGSPAERSGLRAGDRIVAVDGRSTADLSTDQAANLLQGKEGSIVDVTAVGRDNVERRVRVRREHVEVPSVDDVRIVDESFGIGYLKLTCFQKTTSRDLDAALWKLHRAGMKSLIMDLRGNPGGLLTTSVEVVDKFVDRGKIVSTKGRSPQEDYNYSAHEAGTWRVPLVVLIDGDSASASEIFAGAVRDHRRGAIVGARSYGKGSVQGIFPLNLANAGLRLTTAKFYSPQGKPYSGIGVEPDLLVQQVAKPAVDEDGSAEEFVPSSDSALEAALREARRRIARR